MQSYLEASLAFLESGEMRDYLREELPKFRSVALECAEIVAYAPAPIERKLAVLEQIAREAEPKLDRDGEPFTDCAVQFAQSCRIALDERYCGPEGAMFWLRNHSYDEDLYDYLFSSDWPIYTTFFTDFDAAVRYLDKLAEEKLDIYSFEGLSYTITKYVPDGEGGLKEYCTWYLNNNRELWYFDYEISCRKTREGWDRSFSDWDLNLPVPFQPGDIIVADCRPYAPPRRVLILEVGDNRDCCCLQALSIGENGNLAASAFKHNGFLAFSGEFSLISGLYRARRWTGELTAEEDPFARLSPLIRAKPELGIEIEDYTSRGKRYERSWSEVKAAFNL